MTPTRPSPTPPDLPPDWEALGRYLSGESSPDEAAAIGAWIDANPEDAALLDALAKASAPLRAQSRAPIDTEAALQRVLARRTATSAEHTGTSVGAASRRIERDVIALDTVRRTRRVSWPAIAAAALLTVVAGGLLLQSPDTPSVPPSLTASRLTSAPGRVDSLQLADGTRVILGPGSVLTLPEAYGRESREVSLQGEAFFEVQRDEALPFTVLAANARIVDLSTAFTVRTDDARGVAVAVTTGRVQLSAENADDGALELSAGEAATLGRSARTAVRDTAGATDAMRFTEGTLVLRDTPVEALPVLLRRWYGVELTTDASLRSRRVTATFTSEPSDVVVNAIALSLGARAAITGDSVALRALDIP